MHATRAIYWKEARFASGRLLLVELFFTILVSAFLGSLTHPLAQPALSFGLGQRYESGLPPLSWADLFVNGPDLFSWVDASSRAKLLLETAGTWLSVYGLVGLALLTVARMSRSWSSGLVVFGIGLVGSLLRPFNWPSAAGLGVATAGLCWVLFSLQGSRKQTLANSPRQAIPPPLKSLSSTLVWPGWVLFTGLGWLWIADFAARGPIGNIRPGAKYFGLHQADALFLANTILLIAAAKSGAIVHSIAVAANSLATAWSRRRGPLALLILGGSISFALGWLGHSARPGIPLIHIAGGGMPHVSGELLRWIAATTLAWAIYRFGEWHSSQRRLLRGLLATTAIGLICLCGLALSGDMGPVLILSLTLVLLLVTPVVKLTTLLTSAKRMPYGRLTVVAVIVVAAIVIFGVRMWRASLTEFAPQWSQTASLREAAREDPFNANSPNLAQAHWLMDAANAIGGFGLGRVPYCGALAHIESAPCTLGSGAPIQLPSDFAFVGLASTWGMGGAAICIVLLFGWLRSVAQSAQPANILRFASAQGAYQQFNPLLWLRAWLVAVPALMAQAQVLVSVGGTLAWTPLSGVTLPFLGYGTASLCMAALWVGMSFRPIFCEKTVQQ